MLSSKFLTFFMYTAQERSIKNAAEKLNVTPAAVSAMLKKIEGVLNIKLFNYENGRMNLTTKGRFLYMAALQPYNNLNEIMLDLKGSLVLKLGVENDTSFLKEKILYHAITYITENIEVEFNEVKDEDMNYDLIIKSNETQNLKEKLITNTEAKYIQICPENMEYCQYAIFDEEIINTTYKEIFFDFVKNLYPHCILLDRASLGVTLQLLSEGKTLYFAPETSSLASVICNSNFPATIKTTPFQTSLFFYINKNVTDKKSKIIHQMVDAIQTSITLNTLEQQ